jgi:hypothetical protein
MEGINEIIKIAVKRETYTKIVGEYFCLIVSKKVIVQIKKVNS